MRIEEVENLLTKWFVGCLKSKVLSSSMVDENFTIEDGMDFNEYKNYEFKNFKEISLKYDLDENLYAKVKNWFSLDDDINKSHALVYVFNKNGKFAFKVNMTVAYKKHGYVISSNNSLVQIVPKYALINEKLNGIGLAILPKSGFELKSIFCDVLELEGLTKTADFMDENFYSVRFKLPEAFKSDKDNILDFKLFLNDINKKKTIIVNKRIILDAFDVNHKPFIIKDNNLIIVDEKYPVSVSYIENDKMGLIEYPRNFSIDMNNYSTITITDAQDNDWLVKK